MRTAYHGSQVDRQGSTKRGHRDVPVLLTYDMETYMDDERKQWLGEDILLRYPPRVIDAEQLRDSPESLSIMGDAPGLIIENVDSWLQYWPVGKIYEPWLDVGRVLVSWGALALVSYPDICLAIAAHASSQEFQSGDIQQQVAGHLELEAAISSCVRFKDVGSLSLDTFLARQITEVKLVRNLYIRPDKPGLA